LQVEQISGTFKTAEKSLKDFVSFAPIAEVVELLRLQCSSRFCLLSHDEAI
jgi:hypothetical protein